MMRPLLSFVSVAGSAALVACGPNPTAKSAEPGLKTRSSIVKSEPEPAKEDIPSRCIKRKGACMPPIEWAETLCEGVYEDLAMYMFQRGTPWTRFYMRTGLNAVNGWGPTIDEDLLFQEELLVINHRLSRDSLQVEGSAGTYDVLRWNGSCATLDINEVTRKEPVRPRHARIDWRSLSERMQDFLLEDPSVNEVYQARRKACRGVTIGRVTLKCEQLDGQLGDEVAKFVRTTDGIPKPNKFPDYP